MNKSLLTNLFALVLIIGGMFLPYSEAYLFMMAGLFALSGALTNQLAIHMLFNKVPFLYGSGIIELKFESFKGSIKALMINEFFTKEKLDAFFSAEEKRIDLEPIIEQTDFSPAYDALTKTVMESSFGGMLGMMGGEKALEGLREPFTNKLKSAVVKISQTEAFKAQIEHHLKASTLSDDFMETIERLIDQRLNELTPQMVKEIVLNLMKEHLGWLVVWGGVFGGIIGFLSALFLQR